MPDRGSREIGTGSSILRIEITVLMQCSNEPPQLALPPFVILASTVKIDDKENNWIPARERVLA